MTTRSYTIFIRTGICLSLIPILGCQNMGKTSSYTRVPAPGTAGGLSNSYYSLPAGSWTPAAAGGASPIGSGLPATNSGNVNAAGSVNPPSANPAVTPNPSSGASSMNSKASTATPTAALSAPPGSGVQTASSVGSDNPVRIAVFSDSDQDDSQVVPAANGSSTTTIPTTQLPWRNP